MVGSIQSALTPLIASLRRDVLAIGAAGIQGAGAQRLVTRALGATGLYDRALGARIHLVAAGKAGPAMAAAFSRYPGVEIARGLVVSPRGSPPPSTGARNVSASRAIARAGEPLMRLHASHPLPDEQSVIAGRRALRLAHEVRPDGRLVLLLSGGASSLLAAPLEGLTLAAKRDVIRAMMLAGGDISALNTVRKHLSAVKGGRLAAACAGRTITLAISDVVGDDLSVIGSGPGVPDATTWADARQALDQWLGVDAPPDIAALFMRGAAGLLPDSPKPGDPALARAEAHVIGGRAEALAGAQREAERLGYSVIRIEDPVVGEARVAADAWWAKVQPLVLATSTPTCVLSAGETTVRVTGPGRGGRNQEFALALAEPMARVSRGAVVASIGTDGIDGPTDAAGAMVDPTTVSRAAALRLASPHDYLQRNDSYSFFHDLHDLIRLGPTETNVGDLQLLLWARPDAGAASG